LIDHSDRQLVVTSDTYGDLLDAAPTGLARTGCCTTDDAGYQAPLGGDVDLRWEPADDEDLFPLIFTSGSTSFPKAVRCTQGRFRRPARTSLARGGAAAS
jgi:long-subunit acyl-CoA synthetase (AMP-forming)